LLNRSVNLNSPQQLKELLFEHLKLPNPSKGSTGIEILEEIKDAHPIVPLIIDHRTISKIRSTYAEGLLSVIDPSDSRIHSSFNQTMTTTGRLSSSEPNLQNIPIRTEKGRLIRKAFIPNGKDEILLSADYSQIELRLLAHYSQDSVLIEAFKNNEDIHYRTAKEILPLKDGIVTPNDRRMAKTVNFGIIYGMGAFSLSKDLGISRKQAQDFIDHYFARYPKVRVFFDSLLQKAREVGYVETFMHRRRYVSDLKSSNSMKRSFAERAAINMPLQGGAADIMKKAMVELFNELSERKLKSKLILQVHDEILLSVARNEVDEVARLVNEIMTSTCSLAVPLVANLKTGINWYDMKDVEV
jgi:DNA polymerase-1